MSVNDDRTAEMSREEKEPEEEEVVRAEAIGGGGGTTADVDGVAVAIGDRKGRPAAEDGVVEAVGPSSYTNQEVQDLFVLKRAPSKDIVKGLGFRRFLLIERQITHADY